MRIQDRFIKFLKDEGVFWRYKRNVLFDNKFSRHWPIKKRKLYIYNGFSWLKTPEGWYFWDNIHKKWLDICKQK